MGGLCEQVAATNFVQVQNHNVVEVECLIPPTTPSKVTANANLTFDSVNHARGNVILLSMPCKMNTPKAIQMLHH